MRSEPVVRRTFARAVTDGIAGAPTSDMNAHVGLTFSSIAFLMLGCAADPTSSSQSSDVRSNPEPPAAASPPGPTAAPPASDPARARAIVGGQFELYAEPGVAPMGERECKRFTSLSISGNTAKLREIASTTCDDFVDPETRSYEITTKTEGCLHFYEGRSATGSIRIEDYRTGGSTCETPFRAELVVEETRGTTVKKSFSAKVVPPDLVLCEAPPTCDAGTVQRDSVDDCIDAMVCRPLRMCSMTIWCEVVDG
jgi:hypothetical protein